MGKDPAFLFYANDWAGGTSYFSIEEKGAYLELLLLQFHKGKFTEQQAKQVLNTSFTNVWETVKDKFLNEGGFYWNDKMAETIEKRKSFTNSRRMNRLGKTKKEDKKNTSKTLVKLVGNGDGNGIVNRKLEMELPFNSENFKKQWALWKDYKNKELGFKYKTPQSELAALKALLNYANNKE